MRFPSGSDAHPPFQICGNFGDGRGFALELPPALPKAWLTGAVKALRARGGFEVDLAWRDGQFAAASIRSAQGGATRLRCGERVKEVALPKNGTSCGTNTELTETCQAKHLAK